MDSNDLCEYVFINLVNDPCEYVFIDLVNDLYPMRRSPDAHTGTSCSRVEGADACACVFQQPPHNADGRCTQGEPP